MGKISVVIPVYNVEKYLRQCVDSMLAQTLPAWEIVLVDDGSSDGSPAICDAYAQGHPNVKAVHKQNQGLGMARNTGIEHATGDYIVFIDSDDFCSPDFLEKIEGTRCRTNSDTCKSCFDRVDLEGVFLSAQRIESGTFEGEAIRGELLARMIGSAPGKKDALPMSACCTLYSMEIIKTHALRFVSEREWISEDILFNLEYYQYAKRVVLTDYIGYHYRTNPNSLTTRYLPDRFEKCLAMVRKEAELLQKFGNYEECAHRLTRQMLIYLRMCISQLKNADIPESEVRRKILQICDNEDVRGRISEFPVREMGMKQQMFVYLIKFRQVGLLRLMLAR